MSAQDFFDVHSRGRVIQPEARQKMRDNRKANRRASSPAGGKEGAAPGVAQPQQAVIKLATWGKTIRAAQHTVAYITRTRQGDDPALCLTATDHLGNPVPPDQLKLAVEGWNLVPNAENLSKAARDATPAARASMTEKDRYRKNQTAHMILSMPPRSNASEDQVHQAAGEALREIFGPSGVEYLYVVHTDHSARPHAHVVFKATNLDGVQIRILPDDLRVMRAIFAEKATAAGIPLVATAREDRPEIARAIEAGLERARTSKNYYETKAANSLLQHHWLALQAPTFYSRHGAEYQQRLAGLSETPLPDALEVTHDLVAANVLSKPQPAIQAVPAAPSSAEPVAEPIDPLSPVALLDALSARNAVFSRSEIEREIAKHTRDKDRVASALAAVLGAPDLVRLTPDPVTDREPPAKFALRAVLELENRMLDIAEALYEKSSHGIDAGRLREAITQFERDAGYKLSGEQRDAIEHLTEAGALRSIVGLAGTGKSTMLTAARFAWEDAGYEVKGAALAGIAADNLAQSGVKSSTIAALLMRLDEQTDLRALATRGEVSEAAAERLARHLSREIERAADAETKQILEGWRGEFAAGTVSKEAADYAQAWGRDALRFPVLTERTVLVIDEAGMIGSEQMTRLLEAVETAGAKLTLIGDPEQIQPIEIGAPFRAIFQATEAVALEDVRRQREAWMQQATADLSKGRAKEAIAAYDHAGAVHAGINADRRWTMAKLIASHPLGADDQVRVNVIIDYVEARRSAGAAFGPRNENPSDPAAARFAEFKTDRDKAALKIEADIEAYKLLLARLAINGEHLAADIMAANAMPRAAAIEGAATRAEAMGILDIEKSLPSEERYAIDLRSGAKRELAAAWIADYQAQPEASRIVLSHTNEDAQDLNSRIRQGLKNIGLLSGEAMIATTEQGDLEFMTGDRLLFRRTHTFVANDEKIGVRNGTLATVTAIGRDAEGDISLTVKLDDDKSFTFSTADYDNFAQGYAVTTHKAQGVTVDRSFVLASVGMNKHLLGVAMSRHREDTQVFSATGDAESPSQLAKIAGKAERAETTLDYLREAVARPAPAVRLSAARDIEPAAMEGAGQQGQLPSLDAGPRNPLAAPPVEMPALHARAQLELHKTFRAYADASKARERFLELYAEKAGLAVWAVNNRPEVFGTLRANSRAPKFNPRDAQISKAWRGEAARKLSTAAQREPIIAKAIAAAEKSAGRIAAAQAASRRMEYGQKIARRAAERFGVIPGSQAPSLAPTCSETTAERPGLLDRLFGRTRRRPPETPNAPAPTQSAPAPQAHWSQRILDEQRALRVKVGNPTIRAGIAADMREIRRSKADPEAARQLAEARARLAVRTKHLTPQRLAKYPRKTREAIGQARLDNKQLTYGAPNRSTKRSRKYSGPEQ